MENNGFACVLFCPPEASLIQSGLFFVDLCRSFACRRSVSRPRSIAFQSFLCVISFFCCAMLKYLLGLCRSSGDDLFSISSWYSAQWAMIFGFGAYGRDIEGLVSVIWTLGNRWPFSFVLGFVVSFVN